MQLFAAFSTLAQVGAFFEQLYFFLGILRLITIDGWIVLSYDEKPAVDVSGTGFDADSSKTRPRAEGWNEPKFGVGMNAQWIAEVFLLAENRLLREALMRLLAKKNDIRVVGANPYSPEVHEEIIAAQPSIIVLDSSGLTFSNSSLISTLQAAIPGVRIVMVDMDSDESTFLKAVREGVVGYVLKDASALEVAATIRAVASGEAVCPPSMSMALFRVAARQTAPFSTFSWATELGLSRREQQLVELLRERLTNKEIAAQLNLSEQTVKNHVHNILRKVGARDRVTIVERCEKGLGSSAGVRG